MIVDAKLTVNVHLICLTALLPKQNMYNIIMNAEKIHQNILFTFNFPPKTLVTCFSWPTLVYARHINPLPNRSVLCFAVFTKNDMCVLPLSYVKFRSRYIAFAFKCIQHGHLITVFIIIYYLQSFNWYIIRNFKYFQ